MNLFVPKSKLILHNELVATPDLVGYAELHLDQDVESTTTVEELLESTTIKSELKAKLSSMLAKSKGR